MSFIQKAALKATLCAGLFAASAASATAQNTQQSQPKRVDFFDNTEFMLVAKSIHSDRLTPYNEWNPGLLIKHRMGGRGNYESSVMEGAYYNSNYTVTPTIGTLQEISVGRMRFGLIAGLALYPRVQKDELKCTTVYSAEQPENEKRRGHSTVYIPTNKPYEYTKVEKIFHAHGLRNKFRLIPALLATFSFDAYKGSGPFGTMTYVPWKSGEHNHLFIGAFGARINPRPQ